MATPETIALVTGANRGIGLEIARSLGRRDGTAVFVGARDAENAKETTDALRTDGIDAYDVRIDVTETASIAYTVRAIGRAFGRLDVLVNNAGVALDYAPPSQTHIDVVRQTFETNLFGAIVVTQMMLPLLRKSAAPRIVNVSSGLASLTIRSRPDHAYGALNALAYMSSKSALNAATLSFSQELAPSGFKVNAADPGYTATNLNNFQGVKTPQEGAAIAVWLATLPEDGPTGGFFNDDGRVPW